MPENGVFPKTTRAFNANMGRMPSIGISGGTPRLDDMCKLIPALAPVDPLRKWCGYHSDR